MRVLRLNETNFLISAPVFELFFAVNCLSHIVKRFPIEQAFDLVAICKSTYAMELMLEDTFVKITGHADIQRSR